MARCPDCNKFVPYDEPQVEVNTVEVDGTTVTADVRVVLACGECGTELKDMEFNESVEIEHVCGDPVDGHEPDPDADGYEIESEGDGEGDSRVQTTDRNGKQIKNSRYMKTFYGFTLTPTCKCNKCGETFDVELKGEEQASGFNELN